MTTGDSILLLHKNGTTTEGDEEETAAQKMVGRMLQFQLASPLVNVGFLLVADLYICLFECCALP